MDDRAFDRLAKLLSAAPTRRGLLGAALAALGLGAADAAAGNNAGGRDGGKEHGRNRGNGRHRPGKGKGNGAGRPPGAGAFIRGVKLTVVNQRDGWELFGSWAEGTLYWKRSLPGQGFVLEPGQSATFATDALRAGAFFDIHDPRAVSAPFAWAENPVVGTPNVSVEVDGYLESQPWTQYYGGRFAVEHKALAVGEEASAETRVGIFDQDKIPVRLTLRREPDTADHKVFTLTVRAA